MLFLINAWKTHLLFVRYAWKLHILKPLLLLLPILLAPLHVNVRYKQLFIVVAVLMWYALSCLDNLFHDRPMSFFPCFDSEVAEISFGFYFSNAKRGLFTYVFFISRFIVVWIVVLFFLQNVLFYLSSNMNFMAFLAGASLSSLRMPPSNFHFLLATSVDIGFELFLSYNLLFLILRGHLILCIRLNCFLWKQSSCCSSWILIP